MNIRNGCSECSCFNCELMCEHKCCMITDKGHELEKIQCLRNTTENLTYERFEELQKLGHRDLWGSCSKCSNENYRPL